MTIDVASPNQDRRGGRVKKGRGIRCLLKEKATAENEEDEILLTGTKMRIPGAQVVPADDDLCGWKEDVKVDACKEPLKLQPLINEK
jgi:hypothetical protein